MESDRLDLTQKELADLVEKQRILIRRQALEQAAQLVWSSKNGKEASTRIYKLIKRDNDSID